MAAPRWMVSVAISGGVMFGPFVHRIDPIVTDVGGLYIWWYGVGYALGFLEILLYVRRQRGMVGLSRESTYVFTLLVAIGVLIGGRAIEVAFDEWEFYRRHPRLIPALWLGGMATHGLLIGAAAGTLIFARLYRKSFLQLADMLAVPGAFLMGIGRIGNFIDGQIVGRVTTMPWGVEFPYAEGFRHPVVLYDGIKNLVLMFYLGRVHRTNRTPGAVAARFVFWYAFPRIIIDLFRDYPSHRLAIGTGQTLNLVMAALGCVLLYRSRLRRLGRLKPLTIVSNQEPGHDSNAGVLGRGVSAIAAGVALVIVLLLSLTIPSNWTQDVPEHYAGRHPGLRRSWLYPAIDTSAPPTAAR